jgi:hypothetical protein
MIKEKHMKAETSKKGIFIQIEIMINENLDWCNKALLQEIINLNSLKDGCYASDQHFADLLHISRQATNKRINQLENLGYLSLKKKIKEKYCVERIIKPNLKKISEEYQLIISKNNDNEWNDDDVNEIDNSTSGAQVEIEKNDIPTAEAQVEIEENNIPTSAVVVEQGILKNNNSTEKPAEKILLNFEKFKLEEEEKETIERVREEEKQQEIIKREQQEKQQEILNENLKQKTIQSKLVEDIAKQKEIINNLKETGKTNKEMLDQLFAHTLQNWIEEYEFLGNSMFCKQYKNLITDDIKIFLNYFERDLMFGRYVLNSGQFN